MDFLAGTKWRTHANRLASALSDTLGRGPWRFVKPARSMSWLALRILGLLLWAHD